MLKTFDIFENCIKFDFEEEKSFNLIFDEIYNNDCYKLFRNKDIRFDCIFDIGANIGLFSLIASKIFKKAKIISIEPNKDLEELLSKNSPLSEKIIAPFGNSNEKRKIEFDINGNIYTKTVVTKEDGMQCIGLNDLLDKYNPTNYMIKMDCQNAENVLFNMADLNSFHKKALFGARFSAIEIHEKKDREVHEFCKIFKDHHCTYENKILYMQRKEVV